MTDARQCAQMMRKSYADPGNSSWHALLVLTPATEPQRRARQEGREQ
jgi:hypothetical protein